jgi:hypothetical protein
VTTFLDVVTWIAVAAGAIVVGVFLFARRR